MWPGWYWLASPGQGPGVSRGPRDEIPAVFVFPPRRRDRPKTRAPHGFQLLGAGNRRCGIVERSKHPHGSSRGLSRQRGSPCLPGSGKPRGLTPLTMGSRPTSGCFLSPDHSKDGLQTRCGVTTKRAHPRGRWSTSPRGEGRKPPSPGPSGHVILRAGLSGEIPALFASEHHSRGSSPRVNPGVSAARKYDDPRIRANKGHHTQTRECEPCR
jgi:hypothetical protein